MRRLDKIELLLIFCLTVFLGHSYLLAQQPSQEVVNVTVFSKIEGLSDRLGKLETQADRVIWGILGLLGFKAWDVLDRRKRRHVE